MACSAGPVILNVAAVWATLITRNIPFAVLTMPVVLNVIAFWTRLIRSNFKIAIFAKPSHFCNNFIV